MSDIEKYLIVLKEREFPYRCTDVRAHFIGIEDLCSYLLKQQEKFEVISIMKYTGLASAEVYPGGAIRQ